jgi:hypothetical protein
MSNDRPKATKDRRNVRAVIAYERAQALSDPPNNQLPRKKAAR